MGFSVEQRHVDSFREHGFCVFEKLVPESLIGELRKTAEKAREVAHSIHDSQAQRLAKISEHLDEATLRPVLDYQALPELHAALDAVLVPGCRPTRDASIAILFEPAEKSWCTPWHRDWRDNMPSCNLQTWVDEFFNPKFFNQVNCPLYDDHCTWIVPGSHLRGDTEEERTAFPDVPVQWVSSPKGADNARIERDCLEHCRTMPGAMQACLAAGDYMLYRNTLWHLGTYSPDCKRATLHDHAAPPAYFDWSQAMVDEGDARRAAGLPWEPAAIRHLPPPGRIAYP